MPEDLLIARNPEPDSSLPFLVRIPLDGGIVVKARDTWPRTAKIYCHRTDDWPLDADIVVREPIRSISRRGAAIDLVLERSRENRSQFVLTRARGREMIFWQSARTAKQARPNVDLPTARSHGEVLEILVDSGERYAYTFGHQQAGTIRRRLPAGDYAIELDGQVVASVERKSLEDLAGSLLSGKLTYVLSELAGLPRAAVIVEAGYSRIFRHAYSSGATLAESVAEAQARFPMVPIVFCETRQLAQEWVYRYLGACRHELALGRASDGIDPARPPVLRPARAESAPGPELEPTGGPSAAELRAWARSEGLQVTDRGRVSAAIRAAWRDAHPAG